MKRTGIIILAMLALSFSSCKKNTITQLTFSLDNLSTLLGENSDYILDASPGEVYVNDNDYIYFNIGTVIEDVGQSYVYYDLDNDLCDFIIVVPLYVDILDNSYDLMTLAENEFGVADYYYLSYYDESSALQEYDFDTMADLWNYVNNNSLTVDNIEDIYSMHLVGDFYFYAGGYYDYTYEYFDTTVEIGYASDIMTKKGEISKDFKPVHKSIPPADRIR